jgi:hypothetical protein
MDYPMTNSFENGDPWQDRLSEYLDGLLSESERRELESHLTTCDRCRAAVADLQSVVDRLRADRVDEVPESSWPRIASRLATRSGVEARFAGGWLGRSPRGLQSSTLRRVTAAAALTVTFMGGIWTGAYLCLTRSAWALPGWMHIWPRGSNSLPLRVQRALPSYAADSLADEWRPLRRSVRDLDQQLAATKNALTKEPADKSLQQLLQQLTHERNNLRALLDSLTRRSPSR